VAVSSIPPVSVVRLERLTIAAEQRNSSDQVSEPTVKQSTSDLRLQSARKSSLLYQVVDKLVESDTNDSTRSGDSTPIFDRLLSTRLASNNAFLDSLNSNNTLQQANVVSIKAYRDGSDTQTTLGSLIDIRQSD
jgi:hypothetical protein